MIFQCLQILALMLFNAAVVVAAADDTWPEPAVVRLYSILLAQTSLLTVWAVRGQCLLHLRVPALIAVLALLSLAVGRRIVAADAGQLFKLLLVHAAALAIPLLVHRVLGDRSGLPHPLRSFRIKDLLAVTTVVGLGAAAVHWLQPGHVDVTVTVALSLAVSTVTVLWPLFSRPSVRVLAGGLPVAAVVALIVRDQLDAYQSLEPFFWLAGMHAGLVLIGVLAVRHLSDREAYTRAPETSAVTQMPEAGVYGVQS